MTWQDGTAADMVKRQVLLVWQIQADERAFGAVAVDNSATYLATGTACKNTLCRLPKPLLVKHLWNHLLQRPSDQLLPAKSASP